MDVCCKVELHFCQLVAQRVDLCYGRHFDVVDYVFYDLINFNFQFFVLDINDWSARIRSQSPVETLRCTEQLTCSLASAVNVQLTACRRWILVVVTGWSSRFSCDDE